MKTTVVIPNYNGMPYMETCLLAMRAQRVRPDRVIVVDNGSTDGSAEYVEQHFPEVTLIRMGENTGFCGAVNAGIRASGDAAYVILLNNDTEAEPDFTGALVGAMEGDPAIFSAQAKMLKMDDPEKMDDAGDFYCALGWAFARGKGKSASRYTVRTDLFFSCAGAAIYRMRLLEETGLFDERHFAYLEDCDIGWRARILGYKNVFVPEARVKHVGSASSGSVYNLFKVRIAQAAPIQHKIRRIRGQLQTQYVHGVRRFLPGLLLFDLLDLLACPHIRCVDHTQQLQRLVEHVLLFVTGGHQHQAFIRLLIRCRSTKIAQGIVQIRPVVAIHGFCHVFLISGFAHRTAHHQDRDRSQKQGRHDCRQEENHTA